MRTYPRSGFCSLGTSECTLVPVFVPGEHPPKPPFWKTTLLENHPFVGTPQTGRLLNGAFGPSRIFSRHSLCACHTEAARHRHVLGEFVKTSATVAMFDSAIGTDLGSLFRPSLLPQSGTSLAFQHRWQTRGCKLQRNDVVNEDEGDNQHCDYQWCCMCLNFWQETFA